MTSPPWIRETPDGVVLEIHVQPGARKTGPASLHDGVPKVKLGARPTEGKANKELVAWLAKATCAPRSSVTIEAGEKSRRKRIRIQGDPASLRETLLRLLT